MSDFVNNGRKENGSLLSHRRNAFGRNLNRSPGLIAALMLFALSSGNGAFGQPAGDCIDVVYTGAHALTSFKARMYNLCNRTVWVSYCEEYRCGVLEGYYDSATTIQPSDYKPVDTEGHGVRWAACVYEAPNFDTPKSDNRGNYHCD